MTNFFYILVLVLIFVSNTIAGTIHPSVSDEKYIEYGKRFNYVYRLCGSYENESLFCASAVAIDENFLLTAAHVVKGAKICVIKNDDETFVHKAKEIIINENFEDKNFGFSDIAIIYIDKDLEIDFFPELYDETDGIETGRICSISGYGITGTFETGSIRSDNKRRAGSNKIDRIENELLVCEPSSVNRTELEFLISSGDSGGGLFIGNKLAGINSCVMAADKKPNSNYGDESGHTRISLYKSWIKKIIERKRNEK